ncbi:transmembrane 9 superfamily member 2-like isoform X2 [Hydractinia symbiolongicarpus]|uniref:transmembrane 9 superfamily member 2-like isoform X2 n=1 Tax=Hydractinia symbiolongicarpus TaxID=13093 RepID=UPI00254DD354|nr:transmembrane 9 superfamily member 2-like isoform X2 [Hydractinia symbiolongicarpus]
MGIFVQKLSTFFMLLFVHVVKSFYFPVAAPVSFCKQQLDKNNECKTDILVYVNKLNSVENLIPYEYSSFDFCANIGSDPSPVENLGQVVFGDRIHPSPYKFEFGLDKECVAVCKKVYKKDDAYSMKQLEFLKKGISANYQHHWIIDNMPVTWCYDVADSEHKFCAPEFPIGCYVTKQGQPANACVLSNKYTEADTYYVFNHIDIIIEYTNGEDDKWNNSRLLSAEVVPRSIDHKEHNGYVDCTTYETKSLKGDVDANVDIHYTYSVKFVLSQYKKWHSRWDYILKPLNHTRVHWFSIMNYLILLLFLSGMIAMIMLRPLNRDICRYHLLLNSKEETQDEFGWKLVFRPPKAGMFLSVCVGLGAQIGVVFFVTVVIACFGLLSPANRGALATCVLVLFPCLASVGGYVSGRIYKVVGGENWKSNAILTSFLFQGLIFGIFFILNLILWIKQSSAAIPFSTLLLLLALWLGVSVPLTFIGSYFGCKKPATEVPKIELSEKHCEQELEVSAATNQKPKIISLRSIFTKPVSCFIIGGVLQFGCVFIELYFIMNSLWNHQIYYTFGFLLLVYIILVIICSETTILLCYFHLCNDDYKWWWRSFFSSGFTGVYVFIYSIHYFVTRMTITGVASTVLYFGYSFIMALLFSLFTGSVGFLACFYFVHKLLVQYRESGITST